MREWFEVVREFSPQGEGEAFPSLARFQNWRPFQHGDVQFPSFRLRSASTRPWQNAPERAEAGGGEGWGERRATA